MSNATTVNVNEGECQFTHCCMLLSWPQTGRHNYVTPTSYLELISLFTTLLAAKRTEVGAGGCVSPCLFLLLHSSDRSSGWVARAGDSCGMGMKGCETLGMAVSECVIVE